MAFVYEKIPEEKKDYMNKLIQICNKFVDKICQNMYDNDNDDLYDFYIDSINEIKYPKGSKLMINTENNWFCAELAYIRNAGISSSLDLIKFLCMFTDNNIFMIEFEHDWIYKNAFVYKIYAKNNIKVNEKKFFDSVKNFVMLFLRDYRYNKDINVEIIQEIIYIEK